MYQSIYETKKQLMSPHKQYYIRISYSQLQLKLEINNKYLSQMSRSIQRELKKSLNSSDCGRWGEKERHIKTKRQKRGVGKGINCWHKYFDYSDGVFKNKN